MAVIHKNQYLTLQPQYRVRLDKGHLLCPKVGVWLGTQPDYNLVDYTTASWVGTDYASTHGAAGKYIKTATTSTYIDLGDISAKFNGEGTVLLITGEGGLGASNHNTPFNLGTDTSVFEEWPYAGDNNFYCNTFAASRWLSATAPIMTVTGRQVIAVQAKTGDFRLSQNGITVGTSNPTFTAPTAAKLFGTSHAGGSCFDRGIYMIVLDNRRWSDAEVMEFVRNPWQIFQRRENKTHHRIWHMAGNLTESVAVTDWRISAHQISDGVCIGSATTSGATYTVEVSSDRACNLCLSPKIDYAWAASKVVALNDYCVPANPDTTPRLYQATSIGSSPNKTGTTEPTWPTSGTVADGDITWTFVINLDDGLFKTLGAKIPT